VTTLRVAAVQHEPTWQDREATLAALTPTVAVAASTGARLVVLPELFAVGFSMAVERIAEPEDGPTLTWMRERAAERDVWLAGSVPEVRGDDPRPGNVCCLVAPDGTTHRYAKRHPFGMATNPTTTAPATSTSPSTSTASASPRRSVTTCASPSSTAPRSTTPTPTSWSRPGRPRGSSTGPRSSSRGRSRARPTSWGSTASGPTATASATRGAASWSTPSATSWCAPARPRRSSAPTSTPRWWRGCGATCRSCPTGAPTSCPRLIGRRRSRPDAHPGHPSMVASS
jgi:hypothetical protein